MGLLLALPYLKQACCSSSNVAPCLGVVSILKGFPCRRAITESFFADPLQKLDGGLGRDGGGNEAYALELASFILLKTVISHSWADPSLVDSGCSITASRSRRRLFM